MCLSADGRYALSGSYENTLKLWEVDTGSCLRTFDGHTDRVHPVCLSADGRHALSGGQDMMLRLWEVATGNCVRTFEGHKFWVVSVCLSADGRHALSGSVDRTLKLWEVASGKCVRTFEGHGESVNSVCLSADGCPVRQRRHDPEAVGGRERQVRAHLRRARGVGGLGVPERRRPPCPVRQRG